MTEINTFSALVDDAVRRTGRPNLRTDIISYARQSMRECQVRGLFSRDLVEDSFIVDTSPYIMDKPANFRQFRQEGIRYNILNGRNEFIYPNMVLPGKAQREGDYYWYAGSTYIVFAGVSSGLQIDVAYFTFSKKLAYYALASRPATFSLEDETWTYLTASTDLEKQTARDAVTNWLLTDWYDLVLEGTCAKVYKSVGDQRAVSSFALFKSFQNDLIEAETQLSYNE